MTGAELRQRFLAFYEQHEHAVTNSAPLLPENDPTTLFTGSGMQPMLTYLLGESHPLGKRIADSQKSFRSSDIGEVGDNRHTTFFEMLGNWSLGDYFKQEQLTWLFEFLTRELGLDPSRLFVTVFRGNDVVLLDEESIRVWQELFQGAGLTAEVVDDSETSGMKNGRIFPYGEKKNWWSRSGEPSQMPIGEPGGPDSEVFWDFGAERGLHEQSPWKDQTCHVNCDCGRFLEIGNSVFMEYRKTDQGFERLLERNVDFGGGLERMIAAVQNDPDIFHIDLFNDARAVLETKTGVSYGSSSDQTRAFRIILDHIRAATFLVGDGAEPSNKDQGYFTRRLLRRAIRFADTLKVPDALSADVADAFIHTYADAYPDLVRERDRILTVMKKEEAQFRTTLRKGEKELRTRAAKGVIDGKTAFLLYETYGFPLELTEEILRELGAILVQREQFDAARKFHQEASRTAAAGKFRGGLIDHSVETTKLHTATHLLHTALRNVLGTHVEQRGSNITPERLRFDFTHTAKMTLDQRRSVEDLVNEQIRRDLPVTKALMSPEEAHAAGALGLFQHTYGEQVSVYSVGDFSKEVCGGPHVEHTGVIGHFRITKEEGISVGVRRIRAVVEPPEGGETLSKDA